MWHNETTKTVTYGNWFVIEKKDGDNWTDVSTADVSFTEEAYIVEPNKTSEKSYTTKFADISKEGTYRVRTEFFVQESDESSKRGSTWIEFEVKPAGSVKSYSVTVEGGDEFLYENLNRKYKAGEQVVDHFIFGLNIKRRVCVISPKLDEIVDFIIHDLHSGATLNEIIGAYDNTPRKEVITIVDKHEYRKLMDFVRNTDPKAFVTVYSVNEMRYQPKIKK